MWTEKERQAELQKLQEEKQKYITEIYKDVPTEIKQNCHQLISKVKDDMANLNKLDDSEKNIHAIWIGIPSKREFNHLKLWAKYNPEYKVHIWTDLTHMSTHEINSFFHKFAKKQSKDNVKNYQVEAKLKDYLYQYHQSKKEQKTFDENAKDFLLTNFPDASVLIDWIETNKKWIYEEQEDIKKYTSNEVIFHDINQEKESIFPNQEYYGSYLKFLEHLNICAAASDCLRYAVLYKFGGVYLDTDVGIKYDLEDIKENEDLIQLIDKADHHPEWDISSDEKRNIIINEMIALKELNKLNDNTLQSLTNKWNYLFAGNFNKNLIIFKAIGEKFKNIDLNLNPEKKLAEFPIDNKFQTAFSEQYKTNLSNVFLCNNFIASKKNSDFLEDVMKKIEVTDYKLRKMDTYTKLINKNQMIMYHTGPTNIVNTFTEKDQNHFYNHEKHINEFINGTTMDSYNSSWFNNLSHQDIIKDKEKLMKLFYSTAREVDIYFYIDEQLSARWWDNGQQSNNLNIEDSESDIERN